MRVKWIEKMPVTVNIPHSFHFSRYYVVKGVIFVLWRHGDTVVKTTMDFRRV